MKVSYLLFVTKSLPIAGVNSVNDHITARTSDKVSGVDITYKPSIRHFELIRYTREADGERLMVHESRVEFWRPM